MFQHLLPICGEGAFVDTVFDSFHAVVGLLVGTGTITVAVARHRIFQILGDFQKSVGDRVLAVSGEGLVVVVIMCCCQLLHFAFVRSDTVGARCRLSVGIYIRSTVCII